MVQYDAKGELSHAGFCAEEQESLYCYTLVTADAGSSVDADLRLLQVQKGSFDLSDTRFVCTPSWRRPEKQEAWPLLWSCLQHD